MRSLRTAALLAGICGATLSAIGCGSTWCSPPVTVVSCDAPASGTVTITGPPSYGPPTRVSVTATTCLDQNGSCIDPERIDIQAWFGTSTSVPGPFSIEVTLPAVDGAATFTLPGPDSGLPMFSGSFDESLQFSGEPAQFTTFSGTIVATRSTGDAFEATFDLQLETADQLTFALTDGQVQVSGCKYVTYPEMCEPAP
jgi:hypothetical protein